jgi:hypothetical protein
MPGFQRDFRIARGRYVCNPRKWWLGIQAKELRRKSALAQPLVERFREACRDVVRLQRLFEQIVDAGRTRALG